MQQKVLLLHPGTQYSHRLACQLNRLGLLNSFVTGIAFSVNNSFIKMLPGTWRQKISNRIIDCGIKEKQIHRIALPELLALYDIWRGKDPVEIMNIRNLRFQQHLSTKRLINSSSIIGFDTSSWLVARKAFEYGKPFFLDQSTIHASEKVNVVKILRDKFPDWFIELPEKSQQLMDREEQEHKLATKIVVASTFTKKSLVRHGVPHQKIEINPYGVSKDFFRPRARKKNGRITFVYLGLMGAAKGLPLLLQLWKQKSFYLKADLWLVGYTPGNFNLDLLKAPGINYKGKIPHAQLPVLLDECDCLIFPSYFEGFGQVILEAMAAGLPVITTESTAGPDIIENGIDGFITGTGDEVGISKAMELIIEDPHGCYNMGKRAQEKAKSFSWEAYGDRWREILKGEAIL